MRLGTVRKNAVLTKDGVTINVRGKPSRFYPWGSGSQDVDETARALAAEAKGDALLAASAANDAQTMATNAQLTADGAADAAANAATMAENAVKLTSDTAQTAGVALESSNWAKAHDTGDANTAWRIGSSDIELYQDAVKTNTRDTLANVHVEGGLVTGDFHAGNQITYEDIDNNTLAQSTIGEIFSIKGVANVYGSQPVGVRRSMVSTSLSGSLTRAVSLTSKVEHAAETVQIIGKYSNTSSSGTSVRETVINFRTQTIDMTRTATDGTTESRSIDLWALGSNI